MSDAAEKNGVHVTVKELLALQHTAARLPLPHYKNLLAQSAGTVLSRQPGRGIEFEEVRAYQPGDDVATIDWRVTARTGITHTRVFREDRERPTYFVVDLTSPMFFGTQTQFKSVTAVQSAALLAWLALRNGDKIGAIIFTESGAKLLPATRGRRGVLSLLNALVTHSEPGYQHTLSEWADVPEAWQQRWPSGSQVIVLSDFFNFADHKRQCLNQWHHKHALFLISIFDVFEQRLNTGGPFVLSDGDETLTVHGDTKTQAAYHKQYTQHRQQLVHYCQKRRIPLRFLSCNDPVSDLLSRGAA